MLLRTHLAIASFFFLIFFPHVGNVWIFSVSMLLATIIPDLDTPFSKFGGKFPAKIIQLFTKHRGIIHSFTLAIGLSLVLALFFPSFAFGFFLGFSIHLFSDSFTKDGITPYWPLKKKLSWKVKTGGYLEDSVFFSFIIADVLLLLILMA